MLTATTHKRLEPATISGRRLLAVRVAGAAFNGGFHLRSSEFGALLEERTKLRAELVDLRSRLTDALYKAVPEARDRAARRRLLAIKRAVFNRRPVAEPTSEIPAELRSPLRRYQRLQGQLRDLFTKRSPAVVAEYRCQIEALLRDERFGLACRYASPDLYEELERGGRVAGEDLTNLERGLYSYAARFVSKANPFHLFAAICFPPASGIETDGAHEIVLDTGLLLALERRLLTSTRDSRRVWMFLRTFVRQDEAFQFWVPSGNGFRVVSLPADELSNLVVDFFDHRHRWNRKPVGTREELHQFARSRLAPAQMDDVGRYVSALLRQGILVEYLMTDFNHFATSLSGIDPAYDAAVETLQRHHLARAAAADLRRVHTELEEAGKAIAPEGSTNTYFVNSYRPLETADYETAAAGLFDDLDDLKPLFSVRHNFATNDYVIRAYLRDCLRHRGEKRLPFLDVLRHFLRHREAIIERYQPSSHRSAGERERRAAWGARLASLAGRLSRADLAELAAVPWVPETAPDLCFNGPFDFVERIYYPTNVFAGGGRFASRYLLHRRHDTSGERPRSHGVIDVELAVAPQPNLNYVVRSFTTGCGFEARYSHRYERWIDPADVTIEEDGNGRVIYRQRSSGDQLRFYYGGFLLAQFLPAEYQLLLVGHADSFQNPFLGLESNPGDGHLRHDAGLYYGSVCLRRECWGLSRTLLAEIPREDDLLRYAAVLRDWLHERLGVEEDEWYYRALGAGPKGYKPRLLDLRNPLGAADFRRLVAALPANAAVALSVMKPSPDHLFRHSGERYVTELMVEI